MLAQPIHNIEAIAVGQPDVEHQQVRMESKACLKGLIEGVRLFDSDAVAGKDLADDAGKVAIVLNDEDASFFSRAAEYAGQFAQ